MLNLADIREAAKTIGPFVHKTPLLRSDALSIMTGADVYLKLENLQKTGSFKVRGAFNKLAAVAGDRVIAASMGNHAQAVAFAAHALGKDSRIVMPVTVSLVKEEATRGYGADVVLHGEQLSEALAFARSQADRTFIHPFDDELVIAGQGTIGLEVCDELSSIDTVLVPIGGGGLIAGMAGAIKALSPGTAIIGVQAAASHAAFSSLQERKVVEQTPGPTIADGIAVGKPGELTFEIIKKTVDRILPVSEDSISRAIILFLERKKLVVEGAGAAPLAALLENPDRFRNKRVVLVVSGGNIEFTLVDRIIRRGLVTSGRIGVFSIELADTAGNLNAVTTILAFHRANILDISHERLAQDLPFGRARVVITAEIRGIGHRDRIVNDLEAQGIAVLGEKKNIG